jgi:hypothetical protein
MRRGKKRRHIELMKALVINNGALTFAGKDIDAFCSSVLPEVEAHVAIADAEGRLADYRPEAMPRIFFSTLPTGLK